MSSISETSDVLSAAVPLISYHHDLSQVRVEKRGIGIVVRQCQATRWLVAMEYPRSSFTERYFGQVSHCFLLIAVRIPIGPDQAFYRP